MVKSTTSKQKTLSREILVKELTAFEKRLDSRFDSKIESVEKRFDSKIESVEKRFGSKIDSVEKRLGSKIDSVEKRLEAKMDYTAQSFKEYVDSRIAPLRADMQKQGDKMDRYFNGIVKMVESVIGKVAGNGEQLEGHEERLENHERRLKVVEARN